MSQEFLLDTNAFYNLLNELHREVSKEGDLSETIDNLKKANLIVSSITEVEIISVLGKYARGSNGSISKCNCRISENGDICQNNRYTERRKNGIRNVLKHGCN